MASRHLTAAFVALIAALAPAGAAHAAVGPQQVEALDRQGATEIIVRREPGLSAAARADLRADADVELTRRSTLPDTELVEAGKGDLAEAVAALNRDPDVIYAEPVTVQSALSADPSYSSLWGLDNTGQRLYPPSGGGYYNGGTPDADMDVAEAWTKAGGTGVSVAIVDTGVLTTHPDLADQIATNPGELGTDALSRDKRSNGVDDDGNGYKDDWQGWDFVAEYPSIGVSEGDSTPGPDNVPQDNHGHGTHVAGTVAAERDNNEGIAGVAPGARIVPLRALGATGTGSSLGIAEAFDYAGKLGVRVVNASLGGPGLNQSQLSAIQAHPNTLYVIAAGNDNVNVDSTPYGPCALPAANVLCVGASDFNDAKASFSNYGAQGVDVFAPGTMILSTYTSSAYAYLQGTSMASPNTAGVAALVLSARPGASALDIKSAIMASTDAKPDLMGKAVTGGRVNADRAVTGALGGAPVNLIPPAITGTPRQGSPLGASSGTWDPPGTSYAYAWQRSFDNGSTWTTIVGATANTYTPGASDIGARVRVTVTATNPYGVAGSTSAAVGPVLSGAPANTAQPVISGTPRRGQTLTVTSVWSPTGTSYAFQWQRSTDGVNWTNIGTSASTYTLTTAEQGARIRVTVTATNAFGQASATSDPVGPVVWDPPANTAPPAITGTSQRTFTLTAATGSWDGSGNTYRYQWQRDDGNGWTPISGATGATYRLVKDDEGARVRVVVTATNVDGTVELASDPTSMPVSPFPPANTVAPTLSGTPQRTKTLTATRGTWTGPDNMYTYQWQRDFNEGYVDIEGATGSSYLLTAADVDALVRVVVTATNPDGTIVEASAPTTPVLAAGPINQTLPTVSGSAQRGLTLTGTAGTWGGFGNSIGFQWQSSADGSIWSTIAGATSATYTSVVGDIGRHLRLLVIVTNPDGTATATSTSTAKVIASPPVNSVLPTISGTAQRASTLTAGQGSWSGNGNAYTYQWQRGGVNIAGATGPTYTLTVDDVGSAVRVLVTATNPEGAVTATSAATATIPSAPPVNSVRPAVSGSAQRGSVLSGAAGTWAGIGNSGSYQWQSSSDGTTWTDIAGATNSTYIVAVGDAGNFLRLLVTVTNADGTASASSLATARVVSLPPVNTVRPAITGGVQRGSTLLGSTGTWGGLGNTYAFQWQRSGDGTTWANIAGATSTGYELTAADIGATVRLLVTASNPDGSAAADSTATITVPGSPPVNTMRPTVSGTAQRGLQLAAGAGTWTGIGNSTSFQWQRLQGGNWVSIAGATGATYLLTVADVGATVRVLVTSTNAEGSASQTSNPTATVTAAGPVNTVSPVVSGTARRAETLTATPGTWSGNDNTFAYQWQRGGVDIAGATGATYTPVTADVGATLRVRVTATNPDGSATATSASTTSVQAAPPVNTSVPFTTGNAVRTTTLTGSPGTWSGAGNTFAYQWQRDSGTGYTDIAGATTTAYTLGVADVGARIRIRVVATNPDATATAYSIGSAVVQGGPPLSTAPPTVLGTARRTATLTSTAGTWSGIGNDFTYQWQRRAPAGAFVNIAGATGETYTLVSADVGSEIRLRVTATNPEGAVSANSAATAVVVHAPPANSAAPSISGPARLGGTLTATTGTWSPADVSFTYAWQRDGVDIPGATGATYTLVSADVGKLVRVRVIGANVDGSASAYSTAADRIAAPPANTVAPPAPSGTPRESETLTAAPGTWDTPNATISISWVRCAADGTNCTEVGTGATYTLSDADVGRRVGVRVTASSSGGTTTVAGALSAVVTRLTLANVAAPTVSGNAYEGETLTADGGRWTFPSPALYYDWRRCDANAQCFTVSAAARYTLTEYDVAHTIVLFVTATTPSQSATAQATPLAIQARPVPGSVALPTISGTAKRGRTLQASTGTWSNNPDRFAYQWQRDGADIAGATGSTYVLGKADVGHPVTVVVTAGNAVGTRSATSAPTAPVAAAPPVNTHPPVISSPNPLIQQGLTLSAGSVAWDSTPDTTYGWSWERCAGGVCRAISGATGDRYTLLAADVGHTIVAVSTATNVDGSASARSAATAVATVMAGPRWKTLPLISQSPGRVGDALTITRGTWSGPVVTSDTVEMMRCTNVCVPRGPANATTYTIAGSDLGAILRVRETASNVGGEVTVWSARYVGPVISAMAAAGVLSSVETPLKNSDGSTLALAKLSGSTLARAAAAGKPKGAKVTLRRAGKVKGKLVAWACAATVTEGATPPPCSAKVTLRKKATLKLPASLAGKVRVTVVRGR